MNTIAPLTMRRDESFVRHRVAWWAAWLLVQGLIVAAPLLVHKWLNVPVYGFNNFQDQVFFQGILLDLPGSLQRFGAQYYNMRFGAIFPELAFWKLLGPETGYLAYRWMMASGCALVLFHAVGRRTSLAAGTLAASLLLLSPVAARMLIQTYVDIDAVGFSLCALALMFFVLPERPVTWGFVIGFLFGLALNANVFAVVLLAAAGPAYLVAHAGQPLRFHLRVIGAAAAGFLLVCVAGFLVYRLAFGIDNVFAPTFRTTLALASGGSASWAEKDRAWLLQWPYVYGPVVLLVLAAALWRPDTSRLAKGLWVFAAVGIAFQFVYDAFLHGYSLKLYWYFTYLIPAMIFAALGCALAIAERLPSRWRAAAMLSPIFVLVAVVWACSRAWAPVTGWTTPMVWAAALALGATTFLLFHYAGRAGPYLAAPVSAAGTGFATMVLCLAAIWGPYSLYTRHYERADWATFQQINRFVQQLPQQQSEPGAIQFLFSSSLPLREQLLQSAFLGSHSAFTDTDYSVIMLDQLKPHLVIQAAELNIRFIVLMSRDPQELTAGKTWLCRHGVATQDWKTFGIPTAGAEVRVEVLEVTSVAQPPVEQACPT